MLDASPAASTTAPERAFPTNRSGIGSPGRVLMIVGPDGTGKTTLCAALVDHLRQQVPVRVLANRKGAESPSFLPKRAPRGSTSSPHRHPPHPRLISLAKVLYSLVDYHLGWLVKIRPFVRRGEWVIVERGWWDMLVDPLRYRVRIAAGPRRFLAGLMPRPNLVVALEAPPEVITARKAQLPPAELVRQMQAWREILPRGQRRLYLDTSAPVADLVRAIASAIDDDEAPNIPRASGLAGIEGSE